MNAITKDDLDNVTELNVEHTEIVNDDADEINDEIAGLAYQLETSGRRLKTWCVEQPVDYAIVSELARGVAISAERVAAELKEQTDQLKPLIYGREGAEETKRLRQEQQERQKQREREREERRVRYHERGVEI